MFLVIIEVSVVLLEADEKDWLSVVANDGKIVVVVVVSVDDADWLVLISDEAVVLLLLLTDVVPMEESLSSEDSAADVVVTAGWSNPLTMGVLWIEEGFGWEIFKDFPRDDFVQSLTSFSVTLCVQFK